MTENELKKLKKLNRLIESNLRQKEELQSLLTTISSPSIHDDKVQSSSESTSKLEDRVIKFLDLKNLIDNQITELIEVKTRAKLEFSVLPTEQRLIMELRYIEDRSWEEIEYETGYSERSVHDLHKKGKEVVLKNA